MVDSKENYKFDLGGKGLKGLNPLHTDISVHILHSVLFMFS